MYQGVLGRTVIGRVINGAWLSNIYFKAVSYCCCTDFFYQALNHNLVELIAAKENCFFFHLALVNIPDGVCGTTNVLLEVNGIGIGSVYLTHILNSTVVNTVKIYSSNNVLINNK